jgi:hypothetical protein
MLWNTDGDLRTWEAQHWFANLSCYFEMLPAANRIELTDSAFDMYWGMRGAAETAARQQWGSEGIYIAETSYFDGLEKTLTASRKPPVTSSEHPHAELKRRRLAELDRIELRVSRVQQDIRCSSTIRFLIEAESGRHGSEHERQRSRQSELNGVVVGASTPSVRRKSRLLRYSRMFRPPLSAKTPV